jgi:carboxylesterase type B
MAHGAVSEDCLFLNIWTTRLAAARRPVYVYLHGGGFNEGSGAVPVYDGEGLARKGLVVVTINYRLGAFGYLAHAELTKSSPQHSSGNYGLLDQIAALRWIRDNIDAFGGDRARVTVAGQSAGGMSVLQLLVSPMAKGLFHRAIVESGLLGADTPTLAEAERDGMQWAMAKRADSLAAMRALGTFDVATRVTLPNSEAASRAPATTIAFRPVVDGVVLPNQFAAVMATGTYAAVPLLVGANLDEGAKEQQRVTLTEWARNWSTASHSNAYTYFWTHALPGPDRAKYGAFHTSEVPYAMNTLYMSDRPFTETDRRIAEQMSSYWANFAKNGDPNGGELPAWPPANEQPARIMHIGDDTQAVAVALGLTR